MLQFKKLENEEVFLNMLPQDWKESIEPFWESYRQQAQIYVLENNHDICAGGIVFSSLIAEMDGYKDEARSWFLKNYLYIGYVWVPENFRNKSYGSLWLHNLISQDSSQHYWLATEEKKLRYFYEKAGFTYVKTIAYNDVEEELFII